MADDKLVELDRRKLLTGSAALGLGSILTGAAAARGSTLASRSGAISSVPIPALPKFLAAQGGCPLTPSDVQGPFYLDLDFLKSDITDGKPGLPVTLVFQLRDAATCQPIQGAVIDVWQNDAMGKYSGFAVKGTLGDTSLRGYQVTDSGGLVFFQTIFPGWYDGRTTHTHLKVILNDRTVLTTQTYFPQALVNYINQNLTPYDQKGVNPVTNQTDGFYSPAKQNAWILDPSGAPAIWAGNILVV